jgi:DNA invertase Pin-like site-specific DNA recombinase
MRAQSFDVLVAEGLDRLSRDQADIANLFKHRAFGGIQIVTVDEGVISKLYVGR